VNTKQIGSVGVAAAFALLAAACQKPASQSAADAGAATTAAAQDTASTASNASAGATDSGGVVSPPASNGAVNTDANKSTTDVAAASNSFTEGQAKGHIENAGYTDVTNLQKTPNGLWTGSAKKDGKSVHVSVDFKGAVTAQ